MSTEEQFMRRALELARRGRKEVRPNPLVGALIVREGRILGEGWHAWYGGLHAETAALQDCREDPAGATLYVTLEPCCHRGRGKHNPPCTEAIVKAGISRVVVARADPNPRVSGQGLRILREKGISVSLGILEEEAAEMNRIYETVIRQERPFVHLKAALSLDGFLAAADGSSRWISGPESRQEVMRLRSACDAVLTGRGTLFADEPSLTVRTPEGEMMGEEQPVRVFLSSGGNLPSGWDPPGGPVIVYHSREAVPAAGGREGLRFCPVNSGRAGLNLREVLEDLQQHRVSHLLVEGGSQVFGSLMRQGLWDRLTLFQAPILLGKGIPFCDGLGISAMTGKITLHHKTVRPIGEDMMIDAYREVSLCLPA